MKTKIKYLFLAYLSVFIGLVAGYLAESLGVQLLVQCIALIVLFLFPPFRDELYDNTTPIQDEEDLEIFCEEQDSKKEDSTGNQIALVIAVGVSSVTGIGIYLFSQIMSLAIFVALILFILVYKYKGIKNHFGELTWPFDVK
ncbi:MAG: hypothetical protein Q7T50_08055 [Candidatus Magasanikbacteria bacterium]|nr:hypothetical protein [Candidatus Magasanikbacteria bacterium]